MIYLDNAATTRVLPAAAEAAMRMMREDFFNPSAQYEAGIEVGRTLKKLRSTLAKIMGAKKAEQIVFTSGGTEGANLAIRSAIYVNRHAKGKHIVTTEIEHSAVMEPIKVLKEAGYTVTYLKPDKWGEISAEQVRAAITAETVLVSMMAVNNELGTVMPLEAVKPAIAAAGSPALFHTDAVQGFLKVPLDLGKLGIDYMSVSGHKIGGPKGVGALYCREPEKLIAPEILGGGQENGQRAGTENMPSIAAFVTAAKVRSGRLEQDWAYMAALRDEIFRRVEETDGLELLAKGAAPHIVALSLRGEPGGKILRDLYDKFHICVSTGSACRKGKGSRVYATLNRAPDVTKGALRVSLSPENSREDIDWLFQGLAAAKEQLAHR